MSEDLTKKIFDFYQSFDCGWELFPYNINTISRIVEHNPKSVLEFGCNNGKNLEMLRNYDQEMDLHGIDLSVKAVQKARAKGFNVNIGNEKALNNIADKFVDVSFTISVLDHVPGNIDELIVNLKRISRKAIFCTETNDIKGEFYFAHDYKAYGFKPRELIQNPGWPKGNGALYCIWEFNH